MPVAREASWLVVFTLDGWTRVCEKGGSESFPTPQMITSHKKWLLPIVAAASCFLGAVSTQANLLTTFPEMGDLLRWSAFSLGGGVTSTDTADDFVGTTDIYGDVGVAGSGNITMTGSATIHGDLYYRSNGTLTMKGNSAITGNRFHNQDSVLDNGVTEAINTSNHAFALPVTPAYAGITSINLSGGQNLTLNGAPGQTVVLKLQDFIITSGTLTLQGTASTNFVINVSRQFSMTDHSQIILSGGVTWDSVLFNVRGTGTNVMLAGQSTLRGVLMANYRTVDMSGGSLVLGSVIADKIKMSGSAQINRPPISSP